MAYRDWLHIFNVNFFSAILLSQGLAALLTDSRGSIVNITSIVGSRVHPFASAAYATSKAALAALTREMAHELGDRGVRVNAVSPGEIETAILSPGTAEIVERSVPMRRLGQPKEVAELLVLSVLRQGELHQRVGNPHRRRPAGLRWVGPSCGLAHGFLPVTAGPLHR